MLVVGMAVVSSVLIGYILGATLTAAQTNATIVPPTITPSGSSSAGSDIMTSSTLDIDSHTGIAYAHDGNEHPVLKTEDVIFYSDNMDIVNMSNDELKVLKEILLDDDNVKFIVKGFGRGYNDDTEGGGGDPVVHIIVEGGTLTWDADGIVDASGDTVNLILDAAFPPPTTSTTPQEEVQVYKEDGSSELEEGVRRRRRRLPSACGHNGRTGSGSSNRSRSF